MRRALLFMPAGLAAMVAGMLVWGDGRQERPGAEASEPEALMRLSWLAGTWRGQFADGTPCEEIWSEPRAGSMVGTFRMMPGGKTTLTEFLLIEAGPEQATLRFRHYGPQLRDLDAAPLVLPLVRAGEKEAVFENPALDDPRRIVYRLEADDSLVVQVDVLEAGKSQTLKLQFRRTRAR